MLTVSSDRMTMVDRLRSDVNRFLGVILMNRRHMNLNKFKLYTVGFILYQCVLSILHAKFLIIFLYSHLRAAYDYEPIYDIIPDNFINRTKTASCFSRVILLL